jgi:hypothetical protein
MSARDDLHRLVDELDEAVLSAAARRPAGRPAELKQRDRAGVDEADSEAAVAEFRRRNPWVGSVRSGRGDLARRPSEILREEFGRRSGVIVDTGPLVAALDSDDHDHVACLRLLSTARGPLRVPSPVLTEVCSPIEREQGPHAEALFLSSLADGEFELIHRQRRSTADGGAGQHLP